MGKKRRHQADHEKNSLDELILEKAKKYVNEHSADDHSDIVLDSSPKIHVEGNKSNPQIPKRKATKADKEKKRLKNRLKRQQRRELKQGKTPDEESKKASQTRGITYLHSWYTDRSAWTFHKNTQAWLLKNAFDADQIQDEDFDILLEYLLNLKGVARQRLLETAEKILKEKEQECNSDTSPAEHTFTSDQLKSYKRARLLIQTLI